MRKCKSWQRRWIIQTIGSIKFHHAADLSCDWTNNFMNMFWNHGQSAADILSAEGNVNCNQSLPTECRQHFARPTFVSRFLFIFTLTFTLPLLAADNKSGSPETTIWF